MRFAFVIFLTLTASATPVLGQPSWQSCNGPKAGWVNTITISATGTILAGTRSGGIFRSTDKGGTWTPTNGGLTDTCINTILFAPSGLIYAGTWSQGVFRSSDGGVVWTACSLGFSDIRPPGVRKVDAMSNGTLFAIASGGVYRSSNGGDSWSIANAGIDRPLTIELLVEPKSNYVFVGTAYNTAAQLYRSTNGGDSWARVQNSSFGLHLASNANGSLFWCTGFSPFVDRSFDLGISSSGSYLGSDNVLPRVLLATPRGGIYAGTTNAGVYQSKDNGATWAPANQGLPYRTILSLACDSAGYVYVGTDSGTVYRSASPVTSVASEVEPNTYSLAQNYPNPFNPSTTIPFAIARAASVSLSVFNVLGQNVATLVDKHMDAGYYQVQWDAANLPSGIYFYQVRTAEFVAAKKMILIN